MSERLFWLVALAAVCIIGFIGKWLSYRENREKRKFVVEFNEKLRQYISSNGKNHELYGWLIHRSNKMQLQMEASGIIVLYRPPYANYQYKNYPIILNMLPELHRTLRNDVLSRGDLPESYASTLLESTVRHIGIIDDQGEDLFAELKNPFIWFANGVNILLATPVRVLGWIGVIGETGVDLLTSNFLFKASAALVALIGLVSSIIGIVTGWNQFLQWLEKYPQLTKMVSLLQNILN